MADTPTNESEMKRPTRTWFWPALVCALLGGHILLMAVAYYLANTDPSFAVEPGYYQQALDWDEHSAQLRTNAKLGWKLAFDFGETADVLGNRVLTCTLLNRDDTPLDGAEIELIAFAHARGESRLDAKLEPLGEGRYSVKLRLRRRGLWEFRFTVQRGPDKFVYVERRDIYPPGEKKPWRP